jgi:hypothetical protein
MQNAYVGVVWAALELASLQMHGLNAEPKRSSWFAFPVTLLSYLGHSMDGAIKPCSSNDA